MRQIRAKFRCLKITRTWDGFEHVELAPVMANSGDNFEENKAFWDASPSGEMKLMYIGPSPYEPGAFYYIDMRQGGGDWTLSSVTFGDGQGDVKLHHYRGEEDWKNPKSGLRQGNLEIWINVLSTLELYGKPADGWVVEVTPATG